MDNSYVEDQEARYKKDKDPWNTWSGPRYMVNHHHYQMILACIPERYKNIIDMGCGLGKLTEMIDGFDVPSRTAYGIDSSKEALKSAREEYPMTSFNVGDIRTWIPAINIPIDMVVCAGVYHRYSTQDRAAILKHVYSYLRPGGAFLIAYGYAEHIHASDNNPVYTDLSHEIFSVFKKQQAVKYQVYDHESKQSGSWQIYVGEK